MNPEQFAEKKQRDFAALLGVLDLERISESHYRGHNMPTAWHRVYGGQVLAQALYAAHLSVGPEFQVHSQHAYFLRPGRIDVDIDLHLEIVRDGRGFCTRRVTACQNDRPILISSLSFQRTENGLDYQAPFRPIAQPDQVQTEHERLIEYFQTKGLDPDQRTVEIEYRNTTPFDHIEPKPMAAHAGVWMRASGKVDSPILNQALLAYMSDSFLLDTSLLPHGLSYFNPKLQSASLDHALWFYGQVQAHQWHYYELDCPRTGSGRGVNLGKIYNKDGILVATAAQECLMRLVD
ncbi:MAG: thioesterase family protein [Cellvibrionaceae bacterium]|nr:thioesterase family protein [Cellvibrionaceae bacterium]